MCLFSVKGFLFLRIVYKFYLVFTAIKKNCTGLAIVLIKLMKINFLSLYATRNLINTNTLWTLFLSYWRIILPLIASQFRRQQSYKSSVFTTISQPKDSVWLAKFTILLHMTEVRNNSIYSEILNSLLFKILIVLQLFVFLVLIALQPSFRFKKWFKNVLFCLMISIMSL